MSCEDPRPNGRMNEPNDTEMLDWMFSGAAKTVVRRPFSVPVWVVKEFPSLDIIGSGETPRDAIRAAMKKEPSRG